MAYQQRIPRFQCSLSSDFVGAQAACIDGRFEHEKVESFDQPGAFDQPRRSSLRVRLPRPEGPGLCHADGRSGQGPSRSARPG